MLHDLSMCAVCGGEEMCRVGLWNEYSCSLIMECCVLMTGEKWG